jgi:hypothetical protein
MSQFRTLLHNINIFDFYVLSVHFCTAGLRISSLEIHGILLPVNRLAADMGPAGGKLAGSRVEKIR